MSSGRIGKLGLLSVAALVAGVDVASAQLFQWTPEQLIKYTVKNPYDRFPDGRPKVPDDLLKRLKRLIAEEVQAVLPRRGFPTSSSRAKVGRCCSRRRRWSAACSPSSSCPPAATSSTSTKPTRRPRARSARATRPPSTMLQPGDVIVADVFGAQWNFVGNKLAHYIQTTTKNGMIVDGGVYWLDRIAETGMQAYLQELAAVAGDAGDGHRHQHPRAHRQDAGDARRCRARRSRRPCGSFRRTW